MNTAAPFRTRPIRLGRRLRPLLLCGAACLPAAAMSAGSDDGHVRAGNTLRHALPASVAAYALWRGDGEGLWQFGTSFALTVGGTEVLKNTLHVERPDRSDHRSFPSGHASNAFAAATYMHRRHGIEQAWPWYVAATYVGWTRVHANKHRWVDVAGSAALAAASSWWLVEPAADRKISVVPILAPGLVAVELHMRW